MEMVALLKQMPLFRAVDDADLEELIPSTRVEIYEPGRVILREGRVGAAFFLIVSGEVEVVKALGKPEEKIVNRLGAGDFFGEIANMKHTTRVASVRAVTETKCLMIQRLHLDSYIERFPAVLAMVDQAVAARGD
ncbi:MAG: cyclic nucleotide-binding domain-containing protein [Devosia sp.]|nr:cyclic nucleotide-binding domain-containing protein [Devosia sp.]